MTDSNVGIAAITKVTKMAVVVMVTIAMQTIQMLTLVPVKTVCSRMPPLVYHVKRASASSIRRCSPEFPATSRHFTALQATNC